MISWKTKKEKKKTNPKPKSNKPTTKPKRKQRRVSQAHELHQGIRHASILTKLRQSLSLVLKGL